MTLTTERQQFEEWFTNKYPRSYWGVEKTASGEYQGGLATPLWEAWQESRKLLANREAQPVEEWREVDDTDGAYSVSSMGRIISNRTGKYLSVNSLGGSGYVKVGFNIGGTRTQTYMHRVVAKQFIDCPEGANEVNHINGVKTDNRACNLEWVTRSENVNHGYYHLGNSVNPIIAEPCEGNGPSLKFKSVCAAADCGFHSSHIYACLRGEFSQHKGYVWRSESSTTAPPAPAVAEAVIPGGLVYSSALPEFESNDSDKVIGYHCFISGQTRSVESQEQAYADAKTVINAFRATVLQNCASDDPSIDAGLTANKCGNCASVNQPVSQGYALPESWISRDERMPKDGDVVLVFEEGGIIFCAEVDNGEFYPDEFPLVPTRGKEITHWMPLPAAPEGGNG
ncbi:hypothetical protein SME13J_03680 [Serratia marcescens]|nr:hypothetical protein SME13J_03680 [Serratia marcescens]